METKMKNIVKLKNELEYLSNNYSFGNKKQLIEICKNIYNILSIWCGEYPMGRGAKKTVEEQEAFSKSFNIWFIFLQKLNAVKNKSKIENDFIKYCLYEGIAYRFMSKDKNFKLYYDENNLYSWTSDFSERLHYFEEKISSPYIVLTTFVNQKKALNIGGFFEFCFKYIDKKNPSRFIEEHEILYPIIKEDLHSISEICFCYDKNYFLIHKKTEKQLKEEEKINGEEN